MKLEKMTHWRWLVALGAVFVPAAVTGALKLPFTFEAGSPIRASEVNANFEALAARIDGLSAPGTKVVGALTLDGVLDATPITSFAQSITKDWSPTLPQGKPRFSEITIEREAGAGSPLLNRNLATGKAHKTAQITLGKLSIDLSNVVVVAITTSGVGRTLREQIKLTFTAVAWTWEEPGEPARLVEWDVAQAQGSVGDARDFTFGYFPTGVEADAGYEQISSYSHQIGCSAIATSCKPVHSPVLVERPLTVGTLDALGLAASGQPGSNVEISSFSDATTVSQVLELGDAVVTQATISTAPDGTLVESVGFGYVDITWTADNVVQTFNVALNK
jgi:type VI protein secretion system component Hcp